MTFACFPNADQYHLVRRANDDVTLCALPVKGRVQGVGARLPPAVVTAEPPQGRVLCAECHQVRAP